MLKRNPSRRTRYIESLFFWLDSLKYSSHMGGWAKLVSMYLLLQKCMAITDPSYQIILQFNESGTTKLLNCSDVQFSFLCLGELHGFYFLPLVGDVVWPCFSRRSNHAGWHFAKPGMVQPWKQQASSGRKIDQIWRGFTDCLRNWGMIALLSMPFQSLVLPVSLSLSIYNED